MAHHRCTRCKEEVGIRHKYAGGLFCEPCMRAVGAWHGRGFWGRLWDRFTDLISAPFKPKMTSVAQDKAIKVAYNVMKAKARDIPPDFATGSPQKR